MPLQRIMTSFSSLFEENFPNRNLLPGQSANLGLTLSGFWSPITLIVINRLGYVYASPTVKRRDIQPKPDRFPKREEPPTKRAPLLQRENPSTAPPATWPLEMKPQGYWVC